MMANENQQSSIHHLIRCRAAGESYGIEMRWVRSIEPTEGIYREMGENGRFGWFPFNQDKIPVYSLAECLKRLPRLHKATIDPTQRLILLDDPSGIWGLLVDNASPISLASHEQSLSIPDLVIDPAQPYFSKIIRLDSELFLLLSPPHLNPNAPVAEIAKPAIIPNVTNGSTPQTSGNSRKTSLQQLIVFSIPEFGANTTGLTLGSSVTLGLSVTQVEEIVDFLPILPIPAAPDFILGLVNWRNQAVPIVDLSVMQASPLAPAQKAMRTQHALEESDRRLLIVRTVRRTTKLNALIGILVNSHIRLLRMPLKYEACHTPATFNPAVVHGTIKLDDDLLIIPNLEAILS